MASENGSRRCGCGCGETLCGGPRQRFASDACRKRAARVGRSEPDTNADNADTDADNPDTDTDTPFVEPGRCRAGLERWLVEVDTAPAVLVEHCRLLADEVDRDPDSSPLHGRYSTALGQLVAHVEIVAETERARLNAALAEITHAGDIETYRATRYRQAVEAGEDPSRWEKLVPVGCVRGSHRFGPAGGCLDCETVPA